MCALSKSDIEKNERAMVVQYSPHVLALQSVCSGGENPHPVFNSGMVAVPFCLSEWIVQTWIRNPSILLRGHSSFPGAPVIFIL